MLVVGAGNSGAEIALESSSAHQTWLSGRDTGQEPVRAGGFLDRLLTPPFWFMLRIADHAARRAEGFGTNCPIEGSRSLGSGGAISTERGSNECLASAAYATVYR